MPACTEDGKVVKIICSQAVSIDVQLHILHVTAFTLQGLLFTVIDKNVGEPLLGRTHLELIGLKTR